MISRKLHTFLIMIVLMASFSGGYGQSFSPAPYCGVNYSQGQCNQPGPSNSPGNFINDFIDDFSTSGGNSNISNLGSGCNGGPTNYVNYCQHYLAVSPGQTIVCTLKSGITFAQGFAIFIDWNQDNTFNLPAELVAATPGVPPAATSTTISFVVPAGQPNGIYRLRVRCSWATPGANIPPCGGQTFGEVEDYNIYVGPVPPAAAVPSGTALVNTPICVGQALNFTFSTTYNTPLSYTWTGPAGYGSTLQNPTIVNSPTTASGVYTVLATNGLCPITRTVAALVVAYPQFTPVTKPATICQGGNSAGTASLVNAGAFSYTWSSADPGAGTISQPTSQSTPIKPDLLPVGLLQKFITYSVKVSPTLNPVCSVTKTVGITINNPLTPTLTMPAPLCDIFNPVQLTATPGGGTWSANPAVSLLGSFDPTLAPIGTNTVVYSVSVGTCVVSNSATLSVSKFHTPALSSSLSLCVLDAPVNLMNIVQDPLTGHWTGPNVDVNSFFDPSGLATGNYSLTHHTFSTPIPSVCPANTVLVVPVFNPPTPIIDPIPPLCDISSTVMLTATPHGGVWSGSSGVLMNGVRIPSLNVVGVGSNTVTYTAGQGTCVASSSATFDLSHFNSAAFSGSIAPLCVTNKPVHLMSIVQNTTGIWSGLNVNTGSLFDPSGLPTGNYSLVYKTRSNPDGSLCPDSKTITVSVLNPPTPTIKKAGPYCSTSAPVQLTVTPALGSWISTPYLTSGGIFTPSLAPLGVSSLQYVIGTNTCNAFNSNTVAVEAFVPATIIGHIDDQCDNNLPISLVPLTQSSSGSWTGTGITGKIFDPAAAGAGNFVLTHQTASSPSGLCPDKATLSVNVFSLAPPAITQIGPLCDKSPPQQLQVSPLGGIFEGNADGVVSYGGLFNPAFAVIGDNYVSYTISVGPCTTYTQTKVSVEKFVSASFGKMPDAVYCRSQLPFNLNSFVQNTGGTWSQGAGLISENMFDPAKANSGVNAFVYSTFSSPANRFLCPDSDTLYIRVKDTPTVTAASTSYGDCAPLQVQLYIPNRNSGKAVWNITDGSHYEEISPTHIFMHPGSYSVVLTYIDEEVSTCTAQAILPSDIVVKESPKADFSVYPSEISIADPVATLINQSSVVVNNNKYLWEIQSLGTRTEIHPKVKFDQPGSYKVVLTATSVDGCKHQTSKTIEVKSEFNVHIPNSFTPNFDGKNDVFLPVFTPYGLDSRSFNLEIFDRWGHLLYHTTDLAKGWDGTVKGGDEAKEDTYVYRIHFKDLDGKAYDKTGHLVLLK